MIYVREEEEKEAHEAPRPFYHFVGLRVLTMSLHELLEDLHAETAKTLLARIKAGEATAADLSVARQFLKDNGIDSVAFQDSPVSNLAAVLPFDDPEAPVAQVE